MSAQQEMLRQTTERELPKEEVIYRKVDSLYIHANFSYDHDKPGSVLVSGIEKQLWPTEERLLRLFIGKPNEIIRPDELKKDDGEKASGVYIRFYVLSLRRKLEPDPSKHPTIIVNRNGQGYFLRDNSRLHEDNQIAPPDHPVEVQPEEATSDRKILAENIKVIHPDFTYDGDSRKVVVEGREKSLSRREDGLLRVFLTQPNIRFPRSKLQEMVFGEGYSNNNISHLIERLRSKVEKDKASPKVIVRLYKGAYMLKVDGEMTITEEFQGQKIETQKPQLPYTHRGFRYLPQRGSVVVNGQEFYITPTLELFLKLFIQNPNKIIDHSDFIKLLPRRKNHDDVFMNKEVVKKHVMNLRRIIEPGKRLGEYEYIFSVHGWGYRLYDPDRLKPNPTPHSQDQVIYAA